MKFAIYKKTGAKVKVLGTEEDKWHIEFENGATLLVSDEALDFESLNKKS